MLTCKQAHEIWQYEPVTGHFYWLIRPRYGIEIGDRAGNYDVGIGYWRLQYQGRCYKASRVAWLMMMGHWPKHQIDHKNGNRIDDSFSNLREATPQQNARNKRVRINSKLGIKGVSKARGKRHGYEASIHVNGKNLYLGYFKTPELAKAAYDAAAEQHHGEFARR